MIYNPLKPVFEVVFVLFFAKKYLTIFYFVLYCVHVKQQKERKMNEKLNKLLFGAGVLGGLALGASSCSSNKSDDKEEAKTEVKAKEQQDATYGDFKKRMQQITPLVMVQTILIEGAEFDDNGLCKPYSKRLTAKKTDGHMVLA